MARQVGTLKIVGAFGDISLYKTRYGYLARMKGGVDGNRLAHDPAFERTRAHWPEFARAGKGVKLLRQALRPIFQKAQDPQMTGRLMKVMMQVVKADKVSAPAHRNLMNGDLMLLQGFEFNLGARLSTVLPLPYAATVDRAKGTFTLAIPTFVPATEVVAPPGATHFRFLCAGAEIDFENERCHMDISQSPEMALDQQPVAAFSLSSCLTANSTLPLFLALGVEFFQAVNGELYPLHEGAGNAVQLVRVDSSRKG